MTDKPDDRPSELEDTCEIEPWAAHLRADEANFVREYLIDFNAYQALQRCGKSESDAKANAYKVIRRPRIARAIAEAMEDRAKALRVNAATVLGEAFRGYCEALGKGNMAAASRFLEMCGKHVDVQAFRTMVGLTNPLGGPLEDDLSVLTAEELDWYGRIARKLERARAGLEPLTE